nr:MAG TPA: Integrase [Caudoviricetes sp.]
MSICQRKDGRFVVKYKDEAGRWRQKGFRDRAAAEAFQVEMTYAESKNTRLTVSESIVLYLEHRKICKINRQAYALLLVRMGDELATKYVDTLDRRDLENFRRTLQVEYHLSPRSVNSGMKRLLAAWRWCASEDFLDSVPWAKYHKLPEPPHKHNCGDFAVFKAVYAMASPALQWAARTCLALCLRPGRELQDLRWKDVDLAHGRAHVWMPKVSRWKDVIAPGWWVDEARARSEGKSSEDHVCLTSRGLPWRSDKTTWGRAQKKAGVKGCPLYTVRHMAASLMLEAGADPAAVAAQLGHSSVATTASFYTHAVAGAQERAAGKIPDLPR